LRGKVLLVCIPATSGVGPDLPAAANKWLEKYEKRGLVVVALWKNAGWTWDAAAKELVNQSAATPQQEQQAVAALAKVRGVKYRVGMVSAESGLREMFGGPPGARVAFVDRAG